MREIHVDKVSQLIESMCIKANIILPTDVRCAIKSAKEKEEWSIANNVLNNLEDNYKIAEESNMPICQDTGIACIFLEIGQDVHFVGGYLNDAINSGVRRGYKKGFLRNSVVSDPLDRINTGDNTPAMIYTEIVPGEDVKITVAPKGFGSENMSAIRMLKPAQGIEGVKQFVLEVVENAGPNPCPPIVVGVGIGGTFDKAALNAKKALLRELSIEHHVQQYKKLEEELLESINSLGIGPQGFGGKTTALGVNVITEATHIAGLPCAVNINCHVSRHVTEVI